MLQRMRLEPSRFALHFAVLVIVALWTFPTAGLLVSSLRDKNLIATSGWWTALTTTVRSAQTRTKDAAAQVEQDSKFVITGNLFDGSETGSGTVTAFGTKVARPDEFAAGTTAAYDDGRTLTVNSDGAYAYASPAKFEEDRKSVV